MIRLYAPPLTRAPRPSLLRLRHAYRCVTEGPCSITPHCASLKALWKHIPKCKDGQCETPDCMASRYVLNHYEQCKDGDCAVCQPVREAIRLEALPAAAEAIMQQQAQGLNDAALTAGQLAAATGGHAAQSGIGTMAQQLAAATVTIADLGRLVQATEERASAADQRAQAAESQASAATARAAAAEAQMRDLQTAAASTAVGELQSLRTAAMRTAPGGGSSSHERKAPSSPKRARGAATEDETSPGWCPTCHVVQFADDDTALMEPCGHSFCKRVLERWRADGRGEGFLAWVPADLRET